jgi:hypothetical protein
MKSNLATRSIETFGITEQTSMTIANSAKVFYTIISGLYSRKIESICREIISNAYDGHAKRGNLDRPFFVHAPTRWEPWFEVRDFGTSIDHETVRNCCSTIGWSSKEDTNTEVGTFGYGMKSPFAYTSQFLLTCFLDGSARTYSYHIDVSGVPQISLRSVRDMTDDEEQGVSLKFDVKADDISTFHQSIKWAALPYATCFDSNIPVRSAEIIEDHGAYFISNDAQGQKVQIGPVWYEINFYALNGFQHAQKFASQSNFVLRSNIGDLSVTPSRESLEYTPKTVENLIKMLDQVIEQVTVEASAIIANIKSPWEAAEVWNNTRDGLLRSTLCSCGTPWGELSKTVDFNTPWAEVDIKGLYLFQTMVSKKTRYNFKRGVNTVVFVQDDEKPFVSSCARRQFKYMREHRIKEAMHVHLKSPKALLLAAKMRLDPTIGRKERKAVLDDMFKNLCASRKRLLDLIERYGCPTVLYQGDLPEPEKVIYTRHNADISTYKPINGGTKWRLATIEPVDDKINIVFPLKAGEFVLFISPDKVRNMLAKVGIEVGSICGVAESNFKKFLKVYPEWTSSADIFNSTNFDIEALEKRFNTYHANALKDIGYHINEARHIKGALKAYLPTIPQSIQRLFNAAAASEEEQERRRQVRAYLDNTGLDITDTTWVLRLLTGKDPEGRELYYQDSELTMAYDNVLKIYPDIRRRDMDKQMAIYVLGVDALHEIQATTLYADTY